MIKPYAKPLILVNIKSFWIGINGGISFFSL